MATLWLSSRKWVDFKTDVEIGGHLAQYRAQLEIYMRGIAERGRGGARRPAGGLSGFSERSRLAATVSAGARMPGCGVVDEEVWIF